MKKKILFCNIAHMKNYKGITDSDKPFFGGSYVEETGDAQEKFNFESFKLNEEMCCLGFVETKISKGRKDRNKLHIEKIRNANIDENAGMLNDVLVVWCAKSKIYNHTMVVGWYKDATVTKEYRTIKIKDNMVQEYFMSAKKENCVLLPENIRSKITQWKVPRKSQGASFGFGQANIWFANETDNIKLDGFLEEIVKKIENYDGENII